VAFLLLDYPAAGSHRLFYTHYIHVAIDYCIICVPKNPMLQTAVTDASSVHLQQRSVVVIQASISHGNNSNMTMEP